MVKLQILELEINRPIDFSAMKLRSLVIKELNKYGEPLRWAITFINSNIIKIEGVVLLGEKIYNKK